MKSKPSHVLCALPLSYIPACPLRKKPVSKVATFEHGIVHLSISCRCGLMMGDGMYPEAALSLLNRRAEEVAQSAK